MNFNKANQATIFSMLRRRPCTAEQIADIFGMHINEVSKYLGKLMRADQIRAQREKAPVYYAARDRKEKDHAGT
jgi:DNA-binding transcriptional ArsR family regulator